MNNVSNCLASDVANCSPPSAVSPKSGAEVAMSKEVSANTSQTVDKPRVEPFNVITSAELADVIFTKNECVVDGLIGYGLSLISGDPKIGKSLLVLQLCAAVANGSSFLGLRTICGGVLYLALEDQNQRLQERQDEQELIPSESLAYTTQALRLDTGLCDQIRMYVEEKPETKLVVIDTLELIRPARKKDKPYSNDVEDLYKLKALCKELAINIIVVHHTNKDPNNKNLKRVSGTQGLTGTADTILLLEKYPGKNGRRLLVTEGKDIETHTFELAFDGVTRTYAIDNTIDGYIESQNDKPLPEMLERLCEAVQGGCEFMGTNEELLVWLDAILDVHIDVRTFKRNVRTYNHQLTARGVYVSTPSSIYKHRRTRISDTPPETQDIQK